MQDIVTLKEVIIENMDELLGVWESSVRATHAFLKEEDIISLKPEVKKGINAVPLLACVRDRAGHIQAFVGVHNVKIEILFVSAG